VRGPFLEVALAGCAWAVMGPKKSKAKVNIAPTAKARVDRAAAVSFAEDRSRERDASIQRRRSRSPSADSNTNVRASGRGRQKSRSASPSASRRKNRLSCTVAVFNLGGVRRKSVSLDYMVGALLDVPAFVMVCLEMWDELYDLITNTPEFPWAAARCGQLAFLAKKPLARAVQIYGHNEGSSCKSRFALAEVIWDTWTVMEEPAFRVAALHLNYEEAKDKKLCPLIYSNFARAIIEDSDDAWTEAAPTAIWCKYPRVVCTDGNMGAYALGDYFRDDRGIEATLMSYHAEFPRRADDGDLLWNPVRASGSSRSRSQGDDAERGELYCDSMTIWVLGEHEGGRMHGLARKAAVGAGCTNEFG